jgi:hypothetical protein
LPVTYLPNVPMVTTPAVVSATSIAGVVPPVKLPVALMAPTGRLA